MKNLVKISVLTALAVIVMVGSVELLEAHTDRQKVRGVARRTARRTERRHDRRNEKKETKITEAATTPAESITAPAAQAEIAPAN
jgi:Flp pilus assembly protein TadG